jgi:malate dehydrogenase
MDLRIGIIGGGGTVGSAAAFRMAALDFAEEIVLVDAREHMARSHAMDLEQAASDLGSTTVSAGTWTDLAGCGIVVLSASLPERNVASRDEYLRGNVAIVREAAGHLAAECPDAVVIVATNPIDVFTTALARFGGRPARSVLGYSWNDTLRMRWAVARVLKEPVADVGATVIGEHGDLQVPLFDRVTLRGNTVALTLEQQREAEEAVRSWFGTYQGLQSGRTSGWTSAIGIAKLVSAIARGPTEPLPVSAFLEGQYGVSDISLGVPARLGPGGVEEVVELPLDQSQMEAFRAAATKVGRLVDEVSAGLEARDLGGGAPDRAGRGGE